MPAGDNQQLEDQKLRRQQQQPPPQQQSSEGAQASTTSEPSPAAAAAAAAAAATSAPASARPTMLSRLASGASWLLLGATFACAYLQGSMFASTKDSATVWGVVIGFAAYFAWLAVDLDEETRADELAEEEEVMAERAEQSLSEDEEQESGEEGEAGVCVPAHDKMD